MRQVKIADIPYRRFRKLTAHALAEKSQLKPEVAPVSAGDVSGVVPPFRLVVGMIEIIARELEMVTRQGGPELRQAGLRPGHHQQASRDSTLHAPPRADRTAPQPMPDRSRRPRSPDKRRLGRTTRQLRASESGSSSRMIAC